MVVEITKYCFLLLSSRNWFKFHLLIFYRCFNTRLAVVGQLQIKLIIVSLRMAQSRAET